MPHFPSNVFRLYKSNNQERENKNTSKVQGDAYASKVMLSSEFSEELEKRFAKLWHDCDPKKQVVSTAAVQTDSTTMTH